jgi:hypothetical protein
VKPAIMNGGSHPEPLAAVLSETRSGHTNVRSLVKDELCSTSVVVTVSQRAW